MDTTNPRGGIEMPQHLHHHHISVFILGGDVGKRHDVFTRYIFLKFYTGVFAFPDFLTKSAY